MKIWAKILGTVLVLVTAVGMSSNAFGFLGFGGTSWKEEVQLHDGSRLVVKRWQSYGGRHEIGQSPPVKEQHITFAMPGSDKTVSFKSEYGADIGTTNFNLLALHISNSTPYIVATPFMCLSFNKWGRPNPPYVIFKHNGTDWQRITIQELPAEFKEINLVIETKGEMKSLEAPPVVSAELVRKLNGKLKRPEYQSILRESLPKPNECPEMIYDGKGGWVGVGWFKEQPNYEACLRHCHLNGMTDQYCPCGTLFKGK